ncbi:MAG TPA: penicillin-binding protein 2 [Blastocatellia bacterium]|nr:penicillin-binding protein 2 [Blastocatellia bacterium]
MSSKKNRSREETQNFELRLHALQYLILVIFVALGIRFYFLQVSQHDVYVTRAENNRIREIPILASRGLILDRSGQTVLVDNTPAYNVVIYPEDITDKNETIRVLVENLGVERDEIVAHLNDPFRPKSQPILVKQNASNADRAWVSGHELEHPEISVETQPQRLYKYGKTAAHVLGYIGEISPKQLEMEKYQNAGYKSGDIIGQGGIEAVYDQILRGRDGKRRVIVDSRGRPIAELEKIEPIRGQDIITTIDLDIQRVAEDQFEQKHATGAAVAIDPRNGEVLAMVSVPSFDPNVFARNVISSDNRKELRAIINDPAHPLFNKALQSIYPTGSTWKIMMATAALEEGTITPTNSKIICGGGLSVGNRFLHDSGGNHGAPDIVAAIVHSCDGYFYRLGLKMGVDKIHEWVDRFGMGRKTGIDLPSETRGIIPSREWKRRVNPRDPVWKDFDTAICAIGQGSVAVPPMQLLRAEAGIVMGGEYHTPHIFKEARATQLVEAKYYDDKPTELKLSKVTIDLVTAGMWGVVNGGGTAGRIPFPRDLSVGGKTGTAQVIAKEKVRGKEHKDHSWFIGFAPMKTAEKPEIGVVCITENGGWGASASAPTVNYIMAAYYSKKLNRQVLPDLDMVAVQKRDSNPTLAAVMAPPVKDVDRRRAPARQ